jgi:carboxyl-terminal processing protease
MNRRVTIHTAAGALAGVAACLVLDLATASATKAQGSPYYPLTIFSKVLAHVQTSYVEEVDADALIYGAIKGMVNSLDPHSAYLDPDEYKVLKGDTSGKFGGVGIEVDARYGRLMVISPLPGSPAEEAGVRPGDEIIMIGDVPAFTLTIQDAVKMMRGKPGSKVKVKVRRGESEILDLEMTRRVIKVESVEARMLDAAQGLALVRVRVFQQGTYADFRDALDTLSAEAGGTLAGVVIDLRDNPGGLLDQAVYMADEFLESGIILTTRGRGGEVILAEKAHKKNTRGSMRVVLVVNEYTASAAEVLVGALKDHARAVVVGMPTFGKGSVQTVITLPDGSGLKLTTALYATPSGHIVQAQGIEPDLVVPALRPDLLESEAKPTEKDIVGHLLAPGVPDPVQASPVPLDDNQLYIGYQVLRASLKLGSQGG